MLLKKTVIAICAALSCLPMQIVNAEDFTIDSVHTSMIFGINHLGFSQTYGRFNNVNGSFSFNNAQQTDGTFNITIEASSIDTNDEKRDQHLKSPAFFDVDAFPTITFQSTGLEMKADKLQLTGNLTMLGVSKEITFPLTYNGEGTDPYGSYRCGFSSQFTIKRSDFGMKTMIPNIGDEVSIILSFEGVKKR